MALLFFSRVKYTLFNERSGDMFKRTFLLTNEEKRKVAEMNAKIWYWILEGRSTGYMAEKLNLHPWQVEHNIEESLYVLRKQVGLKRYLKILFMK